MKQPDLESRLASAESQSEQLPSPEELKKPGFFKNYLVDTTAGLSFYTPIVAANEYFIAGMSSQEVLKTRTFGICVNLVLLRPAAKFRQWWADQWKANAESSAIKKFLIDTSSTIIISAPVYSAILYSSGASLKEAAIALPTGIATGILLARPYGFYLDHWRRHWGTKPTF
ncbi:MAG TPA: L-alanine exporter AlaE [Candidatus Nanoarchaeia archaeon]|nr:L-alanine exporter AlaE [Candidatus Nanoarchaeia archaeon]